MTKQEIRDMGVAFKSYLDKNESKFKHITEIYSYAFAQEKLDLSHKAIDMALSGNFNGVDDLASEIKDKMEFIKAFLELPYNERCEDD